jgi:peroxiredoxin
MRFLFISLLTALFLAAAFIPNVCLNITLAQRPAAMNSKNEPSIALLEKTEAVKVKEQAKGRVLVVNFWATWCHGCVGEFPEFVALDNQYRERGVKIVGISLDSASDIESKVAPFIKKSGARFDILVPNMDDPQPIIDALSPEWTGAMPVTLIFDQSGCLAYKHFGVIDRKEVVAAVEGLLKG